MASRLFRHLGWRFYSATGSDLDNFGASLAGSGSGDVVGPGSAVDGNMAVFDGTTGKLIKDGGAPGGAGTSSLSRTFLLMGA